MMNLCKSSSSILIFSCYLLLLNTHSIVVVNASDPLAPSADITNSSESLPPSSSNASSIVTTVNAMTLSPTDTPSLAPSVAPSEEGPGDTCTNDPTWAFTHEFAGWSRQKEILGCDDGRVHCCHYGNHGYARDFCCKCKPADYECTEDPDDDGFPIALQILTCVGFVFSTLLLFKMFRERELYNIRQTMAALRQQQRENNERGLAEEERKNARYALFSSRFHFQEVLPDKSNISVDGLRRSSMKLEGDTLVTDEEEAKTEIVDGDESESVLDCSRHSSMPRRLSELWKATGKDECCICLDCYVVGETICAPKTTECCHVFHEGCIHEWIKRGNDKCPLCRVELLNEEKS